MFPIKHSFIFKSRWVALLWAAGIIWFAYDFAGSASDGGGNAANADQPADINQVGQALNSF
jgi:hypothetical protein